MGEREGGIEIEGGKDGGKDEDREGREDWRQRRIERENERKRETRKRETDTKGERCFNADQLSIPVIIN